MPAQAKINESSCSLSSLGDALWHQQQQIEVQGFEFVCGPAFGQYQAWKDSVLFYFV